MEQRMFPPKYHGFTFNVIYGTNEAQLKENNRYHLITSLDHFDLISDDWSDQVMSFSANDIDSNALRRKDTTLSVGTRQNGNIYFDTKPEPSDKLMDALKTILKIPDPEIRFLALPVILPTFNFPDKRTTMSLHKCIMEQCSQILSSFHAQLPNSRNISGAFVDLFSCAYRMRYNDTAAQNVEDTSKSFAMDIRRFLLKTWCNAISRAAQSSANISNTSTEDPNYYKSLVNGSVETISIAANSLCINWDDLLTATHNFSDRNDTSTLPTAANRVADEAKNEIENGFQSEPPQDRTNLQVLMNVMMIGLAGLIVGIYQHDIEKLAERAVEYTRAVVNHTNLETPRKLLNDERMSFLTELLRFLDGERYEPVFQFVYCVWELKDY